MIADVRFFLLFNRWWWRWFPMVITSQFMLLQRVHPHRRSIDYIRFLGLFVTTLPRTPSARASRPLVRVGTYLGHVRGGSF